ncbi:hypothetical protein GH714_034801 [Hevea brasiliensis]|uniref:KIB1-4 beta-propeller domain-containing protein n=1 Tax=Hevea brasiliensis TaxID=3981 RepID=A0A6A6MGS4_HEVBR|nr:hypothetical protein GH714_034801 [Hevea brasiliensis]
MAGFYPLPPKIPSPHPSLKLPFPIFTNLPFNRNSRGHFVLTESTIYSFQPLTSISNTTDTWLVKAEELKSGEVILKDTLSPFPSLCLMEGFPQVLNLLDYRISEIGNAYGLEFLKHGKTSFNRVLTKSDNIKSIFMKKVVVSSSFFKIGDDGLAVMALDMDGNVGVWKMGDEKWTNINDARERSYYVDIIFYNRKFYALDVSGLTVTVDPRTFRLKKLFMDTRVLDLVLIVLCTWWSRLMICSGLNEENHEWVKVDGLEDRVLFLGADSSFSVLANDFPGCKRNCVYFVDGSFLEDYDEHPPYGFFVFKSHAAMRLSKFPSYSKIFYPPPTWLKTNPTLSQR